MSGPGLLTRALLDLPKTRIKKLIILEDDEPFLNYLRVRSKTSHFFTADTMDEDIPKPLRPLTSLTWPYVPEASAFPDPLKRNDPKDLQLRQYEAIGDFQAKKMFSWLTTQ